jgi:hypothetical protein
MTVLGKWRIVEMPDYVADYADMLEPAYILFADNGGGEFAFGCVTGHIWGGADANTVAFSWDGNEEMDQTCGDGSVDLQPDGSLSGQINFHNGDEATFIAKPWTTSSTAC